jgi:hypothetical protein
LARFARPFSLTRAQNVSAFDLHTSNSDAALASGVIRLIDEMTFFRHEFVMKTATCSHLARQKVAARTGVS